MDQKALFWLVLAAAMLIFFFGGFAEQISNRESMEDADTMVDIEQHEQSEDESIDKEQMVGAWRSDVDQKYTMVIDQNGTYEEFYDGTRVSGGSWSLFTDITDKGFAEGEFSFANNLYLEKVDGDTNESFYYNVAVANENELIITYLFGDVFRFERVA
ncbi:MAG: hypothetical protein WD883_02260 [Candidatus Colwellbacteria bacterium]